MLMDERSELGGNVPAPTGAPGTYAVGDTIDTANLAAFSSDVWLVLVVTETFTSGGAATATFHLASDAQGAIATDGTATYHLSTGALPLARLVRGATVAAFHVPAGTAHERYLGLLQTTGTAAFTGGRITAALVSDPSAYRAYADNIA